ncbi:hypothetical protein scyTo_0016031, partial [Scyliorhinus torazame]|nr:hypothetical protein [Scyliorhinus torazame]
QVLRVFKADQQSRYLMISRDTTAKEVVIQALREFAVTAAPESYSLCEVSVTPEGVIKQRRLPDQLSKLADRIQLSGSGLYLAPVARLRNTWEKLPNKYEKLFQDLQDLLDPSRNMAKYRNVLNNENLQPPIIPLFPVIKKDLTFLHEGNDSKVEGLVNFEKLRMIAKEIRHVGRMASVNMDPAVMFRTRSLSQGSTNAAVLDVVQAGGHKKRVRRSSFLNAKKLYEDAQMARKVKQYLANLTLDMDEESLQALSMQCEPSTNTLPKSTGEKKVGKLSDTSPVTARSGVQHQKQQQQKVNQALQVPAVSLYPSRKKVQVKDLPPFGTHSPQALKKILSLSEEANLDRNKKQAEDTISNTSSQLSSPPTSPQTSPRKGFALAPSATADNFSDSGHSEISSRSSIVSNSSFDSVSASLHDDRRQRHSVSVLDSNLGLGIERKLEKRSAVDPDQYCLSSYTPTSTEGKGSLYAGEAVLSSPSMEELTQDQGDRTSLDAADSGRGSWTSCSSGSHDNIQTIQHQKSWETLSSLGNLHFETSAEGTGLTTMWASGNQMDQTIFSERGTKFTRQSQTRDGIDHAQSRNSWASTTGYWAEDSEGDTGTIKRRGGKDVALDSEGSSTALAPEDPKQNVRPSHITVSSSSAKGLIARKEGRYREPPPTPPGYVGIPIADFQEGHRHPGMKPPDYNVALQRSQFVARPGEPHGLSSVQSATAHTISHSQIRPLSRPQWHKPNESDPRLAHLQTQGSPSEDDEDEDEQVSAV